MAETVPGAAAEALRAGAGKTDGGRLERELWRYLGYRGTEPDPVIRQAAADVLERLMPALEYRQVHRFYDLTAPEEGCLLVDGCRFESRALSRNLRGCAKVCLMAATIGLAPDRMAARASAAGKVSEAVIIQAAGAALVEEWCDRVNGAIREEARALGLFVRPRFSPGYGDLPLETQRHLFALLGISKTIGVTLTEGLLMLPSKSVTALIGLSDTDTKCEMHGCEECGRAGACAFRRTEECGRQGQ